MRVLLTTDTVGGVWTFTRELATGLLESGHQVALVSFGRQPQPDHWRWIAWTQGHWPEFVFVPSEAPLEWMEDNANAWSAGAPVLERTARVFRPQVFHSSQFCWGALDLAIPNVITAHSDVLSWAVSCRPEALETSVWLDTYVRLVTQGLAKVGALAAPTHWMLQALQKNFECGAQGQVIPNGRDVLPEPLAAERELRALAVGRLWDEGKGMSILTERTWPLPVLLAGESRFEHRTADLAGVHALGLLAEEGLLTTMLGSAVYLCPSQYEPFGLAAVEAGQCGCAVVCRDLPSLCEVWGDAATYFTNAEGLLAALEELVQRPDLLLERQAAARTQASRYTRRAMTDAYLKLYQGVCHA